MHGECAQDALTPDFTYIQVEKVVLFPMVLISILQTRTFSLNFQLITTRKVEIIFSFLASLAYATLIMEALIHSGHVTGRVNKAYLGECFLMFIFLCVLLELSER